MSETAVFLQVGPDLQLPTIMVRSLRRHNPGLRIVQVSDEGSPAVEGVDEVARAPMPDRNIMLFRMRRFAELATTGPTWFLDADMICNRALGFEGARPRVAVCRRDFNREAVFNHRFRGLDFSEHEGKTFGELYPYVGCATYVDGCDFWAACLADMEALPEKFHLWYGDQQAIKDVVEAGRYEVDLLPERLYACLPEYEGPEVTPYISHYKGLRKPVMLERAAAEGLL